MNKLTERFLKNYKTLEDVIARVYDQKNVYDYEQYLSLNGKDQSAKKLQLCRLTRNFLSHENELFIVPTKEMGIFLCTLIKDIERNEGKVKDKMTRATPIDTNATFVQAACQLGKKSFLPVVDNEKNYIGCITQDTIIKAVQKDISRECIEKHKQLLTKVPITKPGVPLNFITTGIDCVVTDNGQQDGRYRGVLYGDRI